MPECIRCFCIKPNSAFGRRKDTISGRQGVCKICMKATKDRFVEALKDSKGNAKKNKYVPCNATVKEVKDAFTGKCEMCGILEEECFQRLHMDHCHETGNFRGWLCYNCNNLLGRARDSEGILMRAIDYLKKHKGEK